MWFHDFPNERELNFGQIAEGQTSLSQLVWIDRIQFDQWRATCIIDFTQFGGGDTTLNLRRVIDSFAMSTMVV